MKKLKMIGISLMICGCGSSTQLSTEAQSIKIALQEPQNCQQLGKIEGYTKSAWSRMSIKDLKNSAENDLKNKAYQLGADTVVITNKDAYMGDAWTPAAQEYNIEGMAYKCRY